MRAIAGNALGAIPSGLWDGLARAAGRKSQIRLGGKIQKSFRVMGQVTNTDELLGGFLDEWWERSRRFGEMLTLTILRLNPTSVRTCRRRYA